MGYIGSGSNIQRIFQKVRAYLQRRSKRFVEETGIDLLAPSVGSIHGLIKSGKPHIDIELVKEIRQTAGIPLVLHGGSGLRDQDFTNAIASGIAIVHINSEIRLAYKEAVENL